MLKHFGDEVVKIIKTRLLIIHFYDIFYFKFVQLNQNKIIKS